MKKIDNIGSRNQCTYFFLCDEGLFVRCGCFFGNISEFEKQIKETYAEGTKPYIEYIEAISYIQKIINL
jgi:hypothetical protein